MVCVKGLLKSTLAYEPQFIRYIYSYNLIYSKLVGPNIIYKFFFILKLNTINTIQNYMYNYIFFILIEKRFFVELVLTLLLYKIRSNSQVSENVGSVQKGRRFAFFIQPFRIVRDFMRGCHLELDHSTFPSHLARNCH